MYFLNSGSERVEKDGIFLTGNWGDRVAPDVSILLLCHTVKSKLGLCGVAKKRSFSSPV